jgi:hypothetical protein
LTGKSRPEFRLWVDRQPDPGWPLMPLTHLTKGLLAQDIIRDGLIAPDDCKDLGGVFSYFFYGRPAYRVHGDGAVKQTAASPFAFIFDPKLIERARHIHALDTGAFQARLYTHVMMEEMEVGDFSLEQDRTRPNKLIAAVHGSRRAYFNSDRITVAPAEDIATPDEFLVHAYVNLLHSPGRNEPDDRIGTIEIAIDEPVVLNGLLRAVVSPDNLWNEKFKASFLTKLSSRGVDVLPYYFVHGRAPDYYYAMIETEVRGFLAREHL